MIRRVLLVATAVVVVMVVAIGGWWWWQLDPPGSPGGEVTVEVESGWGNREIADALADAGVIGSSLAFRSYVAMTDAGPFQAGKYALRRRSGVRHAVASLESGPEPAHEELVLPPGMTLVEIAQRIGALEGRDAPVVYDLATSGTIRSRFQPDGVATIEGLTWPDTYFVSEHQTDEEILRMLVERFDAEVTELGIEEAVTAGLTPHQAIVVASLIQTEAGVDSDRSQISAVVRNRLDDGMALQIDATVIYARGGGDAPISETDKALESPYNTYLATGLPPTPISTVTAESLAAALAPAEVPYRFYVLSDPSGEHAFAETYDEHLRNVRSARETGLL